MIKRDYDWRIGAKHFIRGALYALAGKLSISIGGDCMEYLVSGGVAVVGGIVAWLHNFFKHAIEW